jgi:hypothetical protein
MKTGPLSLFMRALKKAPPITKMEGQMAKMWIKKRLLVLYPELGSDPKALEDAYQALGLEPKSGTRPGDPHTYFEAKLPK